MFSAFLVRHAEPVAPHTHDGTDLDRPLSERGLRQAAWIAQWLRERGARQVLTSAFARCSQTAGVIAGALELSAEVSDSLHMSRVFSVAAPPVRVYVAHSNNIPVALARLGVDCHACGLASCWAVQIGPDGRATQAEYVIPDVI